MAEQTKDAVWSKLKRKTDKDGNPQEPFATTENVLTILRNDKHFDSVRFNTMRGWPEVIENGRRRQWTDADDAKLRAYIESVYTISSKPKTDDAFRVFCTEREYNPALERVEGIVWDGARHCERFLVKYMNADDTPYSKECSRLFFAGGINRLKSPGCKFDCVIVFIGDQGGGKSTMCQMLALEPEFYNSAKTISGQKGLESIAGKWIIELEELLAVIANDHAGQKVEEAAKAFLSTQSDFYRKPYDHRPLDYPRHCIFIGTTNRDTFLTDKTGNRRWYPIRCKPNAEYIYRHKKEILAEIEQCWAEMLVAYKADDPLASPTPNINLLEVIKDEQTNAEVEDYRLGLIEEYIKDKDRVCILELWRKALHRDYITIPDMQRKDSVEIGELLTNKLHWQRGKAAWFTEYGTQKAFLRPDQEGDLSDLPF